MAGKGKGGPAAGGGSDPLGKPLARYSTDLKAGLLIAGAVVLALVGGAVIGGGGVLAHAITEEPDVPFSEEEHWPYVVIGWVFIGLGMGIVAAGIWYLGRVFEVRRKGVRFRQGLHVIELRWDEVRNIDVNKTDIYYRGVKQGTRWEITIEGLSGTIHLKPGFLQLVPSVTSLVAMLEQHSGLPVQRQTW